jgi:PQQ-like domain
MRRYNGPANGPDQARAIAVSPDGQVVFVTGHAASRTWSGAATVAYRAATGAMLWRSGDDGVAGASIAVSPDGTTVFVAGTARGPDGSPQSVTVAYQAATGAMVWERHYDGPGSGGDHAVAVAVSPGGSRVFVTGTTFSRDYYPEGYTTLAYRAATGARLWTRRYSSSGNHLDAGQAIAVSPGGGRVFVTGTSYTPTLAGAASSDYVTIAYRS